MAIAAIKRLKPLLIENDYKNLAMKKIIFIVHLFIFVGLGNTVAQQVSGIVKDASGGLALATVEEKGLPSNGVVTDNDGRFTINLKTYSRSIVVSRIGYTTQELALTGNLQNVEIHLQVNEQDLNKVVVVGYGTKKKITNTGSVSTISATTVKNIPTANVQNTL